MSIASRSVDTLSSEATPRKSRTLTAALKSAEPEATDAAGLVKRSSSTPSSRARATLEVAVATRTRAVGAGPPPAPGCRVKPAARTQEVLGVVGTNEVNL